ncbi:hypothetical protein [Rubinisphaera sp.]|nr:hypothetical protein [Rubinisphaera sp.]
MNWLPALLISLILSSSMLAAESPLVEKYLHSGNFSNGELVLEANLADKADNDQVRFGLAVLKLARGVERLVQTLSH